MNSDQYSHLILSYYRDMYSSFSVKAIFGQLWSINFLTKKVSLVARHDYILHQLGGNVRWIES